MDIVELDAASNSGVDSIRSLIAQAPVGTVGDWKVYILDEVHMLTTAASNALLKTLEEPPPHVIFVLATTDPQKVLPTILSRTQVFEFRLLDSALLEQLVAKVRDAADLSLQNEAIHWVVKRGRGSARDTLSYLDQVVALGGVDDSSRGIDEIFAAIGANDQAGVLLGVEAAVIKGVEPARIASEIVSMAREMFRDSFDPSRANRDFSTSRLVKIVESLGMLSSQLKDSFDPRASIEAALIRLANDRIGLPAEFEDAISRSVAAHVNRALGVGPRPTLPTQMADRPLEPQESEPERSRPATNTRAPFAELRSQLVTGGEPRQQATGGIERLQASKAKGDIVAPKPSENTQGTSHEPPSRQDSSLEQPMISTVPFSREHLVSQWPEILEAIRSLPPLERSALNAGHFLDVDIHRATFVVDNSMLKDHCINGLSKIEAAIRSRFGLLDFKFTVEVDPQVLTPKAQPDHRNQVDMIKEFEAGTEADKAAITRVIRKVFPRAVELPDS